MKIIELQSENIKRLKAVRIKPDGSLVQISGKNGAGKSSVLDSITMALAGKDTIPDKPIREGEEKARVVVDLGDIRVTRTFTSNDKTYLAVETKEGAKYPSPQALLDKLTGSLSFDPLAFTRMEPKKQVETLRQLVGIDFSGLDKERTALYEERQRVNRILRDIEGKLQSLPEVEAPDKEVDIAALSETHAEAAAQKNRNAEKRLRLERLNDLSGVLEAAFEKARVELQKAEEVLKDHYRKCVALKKEISGLNDPDMSDITEQLRTAEVTNRLVRQKIERNKVIAEQEKAEDEAVAYTKEIQDIDNKKQNILTSAKFPVPGLSFDESGVTYNGIPFAQASSGEQLRVSVAMGLALNPKIRVILIRDGSLLDTDNLRIIGEMAESSDAQIWIEKVSDGEGPGIVIEDGELKE
ncbi:MAG: AAA family ATPase [Nitrospirae bacterium]|nr:AAA family ATPase [Nitrospirota bacterium]